MNFCHTRLTKTGEVVCLPEMCVPGDALILEGPDIISNLYDLSISKVMTPSLEKGEVYRSLQEKLFGKELLFEELKVTWDELTPFLQGGLITVRAGLTPNKKGYCCRRCHSTSPEHFGQFPCSRCGHICTYCRPCIMMGKISACSPLFQWNGPPPVLSSKKSRLHWEGEFSLGQQEAAHAIIKSIETKSELLVWAVCGAGKTEILFPGIEQALQKEQRVLVATPRTDVVLELLPRLRKVFPGTLISGLYGKSEEKDIPAQLVIATTHQVMRFKDAFDTVVIDEVDAFPYSIDSSLRFAIHKAKNPSAAMVYLTATPSRSIHKRVKNGTLPVVKIPRRYHGYPLPLPRFQWSGPWKKKLEKGKLPRVVQDWCEQKINNNIPAFLFVPSIHVLEKTTAILRETHQKVEGVHSEDEDRLSKVAAFRKGHVPLLVTTTILERGVTVPGVEVAVWSAEEAVFSESALVQIAGRAGRSSDEPSGDVVYFHYGKTKAMKRAKEHIQDMNKTPVKRRRETCD